MAEMIGYHIKLEATSNNQRFEIRAFLEKEDYQEFKKMSSKKKLQFLLDNGEIELLDPPTNASNYSFLEEDFEIEKEYL